MSDLRVAAIVFRESDARECQAEDHKRAENGSQPSMIFSSEEETLASGLGMENSELEIPRHLVHEPDLHFEI